MTFELSRDYKLAFELIKRGDRLACWVDHNDRRDIARSYSEGIGNAICIAVTCLSYIYLWDDKCTCDTFTQECDRLNVEFYLPIEEKNHE